MLKIMLVDVLVVMSELYCMMLKLFGFDFV